MKKSISVGFVDNKIKKAFDELKEALDEAISHPTALSENRQKHTRIMFDDLDGRHAERMATIIRERFPGRV